MAPVAGEYLKEAAARSEYTEEELRETAAKLEQAIQSRLHEHFRNCRLRAGENYWILEWEDTVWLALNEFEINQEIREAGYNEDPAKLELVAQAHLEQFQSNGITIAIPGPVRRHYEDPLFYPIGVSYPEEWQDGFWHTFQRFQELVSRYDHSPAEALDYWAVEKRNESAADWAVKRGVQPEAVRKNVRQAKEKLGDSERGASPPEAKLRTVKLDKVPDGESQDEEEDMAYVPPFEDLEG